MDEEEGDPMPKVATIEVLGNEDEQCATFQITHEGHTLGNALRWALASNKKTEFVGYSVPHPSNPVMNLRLQTQDTPAVAVLEEGLRTIVGVCDHMLETFDAEVAAKGLND